HIFINSNTARVTVTLQNQGTISSSGTATLRVTLDGGLTFFQQVTGSLFNNCSGTASDPTTHISTVTCTTGANIAPGTGDTVTFTVNAPNFLIYDNNNSALLFGGGSPVPSTANDPQLFSVVAAGTATPTVGAGTFTPFPTFPPIPGVPGGPGTVVAPTAVVTATLIPQPATRTPLPRPANAGQAVGPIPHANVTVVVDRDGVNVRLLPALGAEVIATVNAGFSTTILARSPDNEWVEVQINGELGWIGTAVLAIVSGDLNSAPVADPRTIPYGGFENPRAGLTSVTSQYTGKLQNSGLRVRGGPSRAYPVLANAPRYTIFSILGRTSDNLWLQVNFEGTLGWVAMQFVELQQGLGTLDALPIDGIVADALPISEPTADNLTDTLRLMLSRIDLAQPSLDAIRSIWMNVALGQSAQCGNYPARPTNMNIPNPVLAPFYGTLFPLNTDFNTAMTNLRLAIDLLIDACSRPQPAEGVVGQAVVQQALDAINATDALFASLRQRLAALLPPEGPIGDDQCLFSFNNRSQVVPRLRTGEAKIVHLSRSDFVLGFCFDGGTGQSFSLQALRVNGNAAPRVTVSAFDNPTNFIATGEIGTSALDSNTNSVTLQPILITQTGRYLVILADLDGAPDGPLSSDIALLLTDITSGGGGVTLGIDPATGNVIISPNPISPVIGIGLTPGIPGGISLTPIGTG
ncbi:MAG: SH3 domain-containing protein, partial [Anaerolineae bacterium]